MPKIRLTKEFRFEMAHALEGYDGLCKHMHGHSYILTVTIIGEPINTPGHPKHGMVMDFGELKRIVNPLIVDRFDHAVAVMANTPTHKKLIEVGFNRIEALPFQPTCENLIYYFAEIISSKLPDSVKLHHLKLNETATSYAEWYASDNNA
ncbi:MAG: 6-pyruvoyltetrahydropterin/6-carboxytetrahydropterin synthase [Tenuifilum sp.]|jgi:6-pyruvoyltetrahydropterin/6-carboxytetrahydropterin synthase|uniref:6-pyruvoyl trahydropterin synthase family protein n=1 Tax=Tenuifilum sp. TaxID=2760880 RepID=UPI0024AAD47A|nr:6-carboxytetrahydropterin synthase [Tenuifilum sp.]MDI3526205.1 6-pyruvoyltetrahydropterin/6-carboxytetrahydropterin synthase [Tenuifilum sp.]